MLFNLFASALLLAAGPVVGRSIAVRSEEPALLRRAPTPGCLNDQSRLCWDGTYNIDTNYYQTGPRTGRVVEYTLDIQNITLAPDGRPRQVLAINGQIPGPTIVADWGDTIRVTVKNSMQHNGTSIHWHGIRMLNNFKNDGVNGITECPVAPNDSKVYEFIAEQYGTTWYHSHYSAQYGDGVWGAVQINGPATDEYDIDLGTVTLSDWFALQTAFQKGYAAERGGPPPSDNFLVNGTNVNPNNTAQGERFKLTFTPGKKHRVRFINTSVDTFFRVALDGHNMTVIQADFNPVNPYSAQTVGIAIGQRYDVIIEANQDATKSYWLRTYPQAPCSSRNTNDGSGTANAYVAYEGVTALPTSTATPFTASCIDETITPHVLINIDQSGFPGNDTTLEVSAPFRVNQSGSQVFRWSIGGPLDMSVDFSNPTVSILENNQTVPPSLNSFFIDGAGQSSVYWVIHNQGGGAHPIHLHLHDFNVIASGTGTFDPQTSPQNWVSPPRRDVAMLPGNGYLFIVFKADNPGVALMHCHIAWHVSQGLALELIERASEINFSVFDNEWQDTCTKWDAWYTSPLNVYGPKTDSGLRQRPGRR